MNQASTDKAIRVPLEPVPGSGGVFPPIRALTANLLLNPIQPVETGGLAFAVEILNQGSADIPIRNPLDSLKVLLEDSEGRPLPLPKGKPARDKINYVGSYQPALPHRVMHIRESSGGMAPDLAEDVWVLAAGRSVEVRIVVDRTLPPGSSRGELVAETLPVRPGAYRLRVILPLITEHPLRERVILQSEAVGVTLAAPPA